MLSASPLEQKEEEEKAHPNKSVSGLQCLHVSPSVCLVLRLQFNFHLTFTQTPTDTPPPLPTTPLPDDYYEEAVPLDPGSTPQYFTTNMSSSVAPAHNTDFHIHVLYNRAELFQVSLSLFPLIIICSSLLASRNSVEDAYYEDADNNYPITRINGPPKNSCEHSCLFFTITMYQTKNN